MRFRTTGSVAANMAQVVWGIAIAWAAIAPCESAMAAVGPVPQWIWLDAYPRRGQTVWFQRAFDLEGKPQKAELSGLADDRMTMFINGQEAAKISTSRREEPCDVAALLREGTNQLTIEAHNDRGPAGIVVRLRIVDGQGLERIIVSDPLFWSATDRVEEVPQDGISVQEGKAANVRHPEDIWRNAQSLGLLGVPPWGQPEGEADDYDQWKKALPAGAASSGGDVQAMPGFEVELLKSAAPEEGSWIAMAFDPQGRLTISREGRRKDNGLLRLTLPQDSRPIAVENLNDSLEECRGLLYAHGALYANANNSRGLYRLRDTDGDDKFDEVTLLKATGGGVGHGRNDLALGPDGMIYSIHGNNVLLPEDYQTGNSPFRNFGSDRLRPCFWDRLLFDAGVEPPAGHVVRTDPDGKTWEVVAGGFRNAYGLDFNAEGELFTYDADMEWDVNAPWYKPTRINHVVSGGEYGYRQGTANRPAWLPDNLPTNLDIGLGSPTAVKFGTKSNFPAPYQRALFALDWSYGRIYAIHMARTSAGFVCSADRFVEGRPLNVTDIDFGPDGAMYFITGGRDTQSGLYRVRYVGPLAPHLRQLESLWEENIRTATAFSDHEPRSLVNYHHQQAAGVVDLAWGSLNLSNPWHRQDARVAIERQPVEQWRLRALTEDRPTAALTALMALARVDAADVQPELLARLNHWLSAELTPEQQVIAVRCYTLSFVRQGRPTAALVEQAREKLEETYPAEFSQFNQQVCELLAYLESPALVAKTLDLLDESDTTEDQLCYLYTLRNVRVGWTVALRERYFQWLRKADTFAGSVYMPTFVSYIRSEAEAWLSDDDRAALGDLVTTGAVSAETFKPPPQRPVVREWKMEDLADSLEAAGRGRNFDRGEALYTTALCNRCHKLGTRGLPLGPELTAVGKRFNRKDLLESIVNPSKVVDEKYRTSVLQTGDGETLTGRIIGGSETTLIISTDPLDPRKTRHVPLADIEQQSTSPVSLMPAGMLNSFTQDEILDLLAYLQSGGDRQAPNFQP